MQNQIQTDEIGMQNIRAKAQKKHDVFHMTIKKLLSETLS